MADRGSREEIVLATKVGGGRAVCNLQADTVEREAHASLERLNGEEIREQLVDFAARWSV